MSSSGARVFFRPYARPSRGVVRDWLHWVPRRLACAVTSHQEVRPPTVTVNGRMLTARQPTVTCSRCDLNVTWPRPPHGGWPQAGTPGSGTTTVRVMNPEARSAAEVAEEMARIERIHHMVFPKERGA